MNQLTDAVPFDVTYLAHTLGGYLELMGIGVIIVGSLLSTVLFLYRVSGPEPFEKLYHQYRTYLGRAILLGLEFLVAADIIGTVAVEPTFQNLGVLGLIVAIRTFLSFSLEVEINGHWPWQGAHQSDQ